MTLPTKITVIGAGSASFGENTLSAIMRSKKLRGSKLALVDRNAESLEIVRSLANRLNREWEAGFVITAHTHHREALADSDFVVNAIEVGAREGLWRSDFEIPIKYGVTAALFREWRARRLRARGAQYRSHHADRARYGRGLPARVVCQFYKSNDPHL